MIQSDAMDSTDLVSEIVKVPVEAALNSTLLGCCLTISIWSCVIGVLYAVLSACATSADVGVCVTL